MDSSIDWYGNIYDVVINENNHFQLRDACSFARAVFERYFGANVVFTGDSLGGLLAQLVIIYDYPDKRAVIFDAPGVEMSHLRGSYDVYYFYIEDWGSLETILHNMNDRISNSVFYISGLSGYGISNIFRALRNNNNPVTYPYDRIIADLTAGAVIAADSSSIPFHQAIRIALYGLVESDPNIVGNRQFLTILNCYMEGLFGRNAFEEFLTDVIHETNGQCFPCETMITMANNTQRRIEDVRVGDVVLSFDPAIGAHLPRAVTKLYRGETQAWIGLTYISGGAEKMLGTTTEHPFLTLHGSFAPISQLIGTGERWAA